MRAQVSRRTGILLDLVRVDGPPGGRGRARRTLALAAHALLALLALLAMLLAFLLELGAFLAFLVDFFPLRDGALDAQRGEADCCGVGQVGLDPALAGLLGRHLALLHHPHALLALLHVLFQAVGCVDRRYGGETCRHQGLLVELLALLFLIGTVSQVRR